jgi:hypothetical protein
MRRIKNPKNLLVQYKGGGYDGCFWEWNYFLFDANGKFHNLVSSGYNGITEKSKALDLLNYNSDNYYSYKLTNKKSIDEFQKESAEAHVVRVINKVNGIYPKPVMYWECDKCNMKQYDDEMFHDGYKGNGGIGVQMLGKLCSECYSCGVCDYCGEYDADVKTEIDSMYCCKYCVESLKEKQSEVTPHV